MSSYRRRSPSPRRSSSSSHRRRSPSPRRDRDRDRDRRSSPEPPRKETDLPTEFTRDRDEFQKDDNKNVLERMERSYRNGPLEVLYKCVKEQLKVKIWTRNFKQMRGICTGFVTAFDKHWNLALRDVDEIGLIPKKGKTPYIWELKPGDADHIPEAKPKEYVEKKKKAPPPEEEATSPDKDKEETDEAPSTDQEMKTEGGAEGEKKKRKRKKKKTRINKRHVNQMFIRGDNVVLLSVLSPTTS